jgi:hypothetical protein
LNTRYSWLTVLIAPKPDKRRADTPAANEESSPAVTQEEPKASKQLDDAQFDDLRRRDWYFGKTNKSWAGDYPLNESRRTVS